MKKFLLTLFGVLYVGLFTGLPARAIEVDPLLYNTGSYSIKFSDYVGESENSGISTADNGIAFRNRIESGSQYFPTTFGSAGFQYADIYNAGAYNEGKNGIRFSKTDGKANGWLFYNVPAAGKVNASSIVLEVGAFATSATKFFDATMTLIVNGKQVGATVAVDKELTPKKYVFELDELTALETVRLEAYLPFYLKSITVNYANAKKPANLSFNDAVNEIKIGDVYSGQKLNNPNNLVVTYTSSNAAVAAVDAEGNVTVNGKGSTVIKAAYAGIRGTSDFAAGSAEYTLVVNAADAKPAGLLFAQDAVNMQYDVNYTGQTLANPNGLDVTYTSNNESVATVDAQGKVTLVGVGSATIKAETAGGEKDGNTYGAGSAQYTINVTKRDVKLSWSGKTNYNIGETFQQPTLTVEPEEAREAVVYTTFGLLSNGANNQFVLNNAEDGLGRVTASIDSKLYQGASAEFTVRVSDPTKIEDVLTAEELNSSSYVSTTSGVTYGFKGNILDGGLFQITNAAGNGLWISNNKYKLVVSKVKFIFGGKKTTTNIKVSGSNQAMPNLGDYTQKPVEFITYETGKDTEYVFTPAAGEDMRGLLTTVSGNLNLQEIVFVYEKVQPAYGYDKTAYTIVKGVETFTQPILKNLPEDNDFVVEYASDNALVTVDKNGANFKVNETVVNDDDEEGVTATVTVSNAENAIYKAHSASYTLTVKPKTAEPAGLSFGEKTDFDVTYGEAFAAPELSKATIAAAKYTSSNTAVAEVAADGTVTIKGAGTAMITAHCDAVTVAAEGGNKYFEGDAYYTINVAKASVEITWPEDGSINLGGEFTAPDFNVEAAESIMEEAREAVKLTATGLLSIADGKIVLAEGLDGYGTVTASIESDNFVATSATYTLTVTDPTKIEDELLMINFATVAGVNQWASKATGVTYATNGSNNGGNFRLIDNNGVWISANANGLEVSKVTLVYNNATTNNRVVTLYTSDKVEAATGDYTNVAATFVKDADNLECEYRSQAGVKGLYLKSPTTVVVSKIIVQYSKITPSYKFAKDSYSVHYGDDSFVAPKVNDVPEGVTVTYSTEENDAAYFNEDGVLVLKEVVGDPKTATIIASNEAEGIYNAYQTSYILEVQEKLEDLGELAISVNNEAPEYNNDGEIEVTALEANVKVSVLNATKLVVKVDDEIKYEGSNSYFEWSIDELGKYTVSVTATAPNGEDTTFDAFTINAIPNPDRALGEGFEINSEYVDAESSVLVNVGQKVTISIANAVEFTVNDAKVENGVYYFYPADLGTVTLKLFAKDVYGQECSIDATLDVQMPDDEILDFTKEDYGMTRFTEGSVYNGDAQQLTGTSYTYTVNNATRLWQNTGLRFNYRGNAAGELTIAAPDGYKIASVKTLDSNLREANYGTLTTTIAFNKLTATVVFNSQEGQGTSLPALKVEIQKAMAPTGPEGLTPLHRTGDVDVVYYNGKWSVQMRSPYDGVVIYYKHFPTKRNAPRRVDSKGTYPGQDGFVLGEDGYDKAEANDDGTVNIPEISSPGVLLYYAHHPETGITGYEGAVTLKADGSVTGIEEVEAKGEGAGEVYDLQGRRISKPTRGLYIQNGQKVLIRK